MINLLNLTWSLPPFLKLVQNLNVFLGSIRVRQLSPSLLLHAPCLESALAVLGYILCGWALIYVYELNRCGYLFH